MEKYNLTVMIVDNDLTFVEELSEMLQNGGYRSFACTSANVSLPVVRQQRPDIILLDINQDEVDGYQLALRLRNDTQLAMVPIIAMSAYFDCQPHDIVGSHYGFQWHLTKPFSPPDMFARIDQALATTPQPGHADETIAMSKVPGIAGMISNKETTP
jgi:CheY-like chemotaxis protein